MKSGQVTYPSSAGEVEIQFGINRWVRIDLRGHDPVQQQVEKQTELARLLRELGLGELEATKAAAEAWGTRPSTAGHTAARAGESNMRATGLPRWGLVLILAAFVALSVYLAYKASGH